MANNTLARTAGSGSIAAAGQRELKARDVAVETVYRFMIGSRCGL